MQYDNGIVSFLNAKHIMKVKEPIKLFLKYKGSDLNPNHVFAVSDFIQNNWESFASFIDRSIKSGAIAGKPVKLNTYFEENRIRKETVGNEYSTLSPDQRKLINFIKKDWGTGKLQSFVTKQGYLIPQKTNKYTSGWLNNLPLVDLVISIGVEEFYKSLKP